ncbi:hypothetical protein LPTSP4_27560 [Leptospira ryugenii]|uniref:Uncharacterized protein n=1 Tax=Leptospira ryugenii TaxID=1917863 RepID=A0A2P2E300_9LEPT|nr:hypothetical protein LPTSP4_27560 [Leptospira ryugenii]
MLHQNRALILKIRQRLKCLETLAMGYESRVHMKRLINFILIASIVFLQNCSRYPGCKNNLRNSVEELCIKNIEVSNNTVGLTEVEARDIRNLAYGICFYKLLETNKEIKNCENF